MRSLVTLVTVALVLNACGSDAADGTADSAVPRPPASTADGASTRGSTSSSPAPTEADAPEEGSTTTLPRVTVATAVTNDEPEATDPTPDSSPLPDGPLPEPRVVLEEVIQVDRPTEVAVLPGDDRLFVAERAGRVLAVEGGSAEVVLDISSQTSSSSSEQGLLGLAFHPSEPLAYVHFSDQDGDTVVAEFAVDAATGQLDTASQRTVLTVDQPYPNHNGGRLEFGPDGLLYLGLGDGGSGGDPDRVALDLTSPLGKLHRFDPRSDGTAPFTIPDDNPFPAEDGYVPTIWAYGLRNPWKFSFDRATGDLWVADVGQEEREEINRARAAGGRRTSGWSRFAPGGRGVNFGWSAWEGDLRYNDDQPADGSTAPVLVYDHVDGRCSVSGGVVARSEASGSLAGWYVFGDYCSGDIWGFDTTSAADSPVVVTLARLSQVAGVAEGPDGMVYAYSQDGAVARLTAS